MTRKVLREIKLLRKLTEMKDNIFTTKLYDIIIPKKAIIIKNNEETYDTKNLTHIFIVMEV